MIDREMAIEAALDAFDDNWLAWNPVLMRERMRKAIKAYEGYIANTGFVDPDKAEWPKPQDLK